MESVESTSQPINEASHAMPCTRNHTLLQWAWMRQQWTRNALVAHCICSPHQDQTWQVVRDQVTIEASMFLIGI